MHLIRFDYQSENDPNPFILCFKKDDTGVWGINLNYLMAKKREDRDSLILELSDITEKINEGAMSIDAIKFSDTTILRRYLYAKMDNVLSCGVYSFSNSI